MRFLGVRQREECELLLPMQRVSMPIALWKRSSLHYWSIEYVERAYGNRT